MDGKVGNVGRGGGGGGGGGGGSEQKQTAAGEEEESKDTEGKRGDQTSVGLLHFPL